MSPPCLVRAVRTPFSRITIAIPVRDEAERVGRLLRALGVAARRSPLPVRAILLANNCTDRTVDIISRFRDPMLEVDLHQVSYGPGDASAGRARRDAMDLAALDGALVMTTDGDAIPDPNWICGALRAAHFGADLVCGTIRTSVPHVLATFSGARITRAEASYSELLHEVRHCIDQMAGRQPVGGTRPHYIESAASLAIRADSYHLIGGLPHVASSEDRALVHRAESLGLAVRYVGGMDAWVSPRLDGRAEGGMAECLRQRMSEEDPPADQSMLVMETLSVLWRRAAAGVAEVFPTRAQPVGRSLHASGLEAEFPALRHFVEEIVRPEFMEWRRNHNGVN